jgi:hypothetical protein
MDNRNQRHTQDQPGSPSRDQVEGTAAPLNDPDPEDNENPAGGDQDIDTAGTDADDESPTKALGTGVAPSRSKG